MSSKIFGIGLSKTGTTSLIKALKILGYTAVHYPRNLTVIKHYDAAADISVAYSFKELDKTYPNSKFILTIRDEKQWKRSIKNHGILYPPHTKSEASLVWRKKVWGTIELDEYATQAAYTIHHNEVITYFADRSDDLLVLNICGGDGWEKLCPFLHKPIPQKKFPKLNVTKNKYKYKKIGNNDVFDIS